MRSHCDSDVRHISVLNVRPHQIICVNKICFQRIFANKFTIQITLDGTVFTGMDARVDYIQRNGTGDHTNKQIEARKLQD